MEELELPPLTPVQIEKYHAWWAALSAPWKKAFNEVFLKRTSEEMPDDALLHSIWHAPAMRFAGPGATYPNMSFELEDLSGVAPLTNVTIFVMINHRIKSLTEISHWKQLGSLFVLNNQLSDIRESANFESLQEFYFQNNQVDSLKPLEQLTQLHTIYCNYNRIASLEGIGEQHATTLKQFICLPNDLLLDREVLRFEREVGIRCLKA